VEQSNEEKKMARPISPINISIQQKKLDLAKHNEAISNAKDKRIVLQNEIKSLVAQKKAGKK
jgi:hypothetical protein